jgi:hypothetical protein
MAKVGRVETITTRPVDKSIAGAGIEAQKDAIKQEDKHHG